MLRIDRAARLAAVGVLSLTFLAACGGHQSGAASINLSGGSDLFAAQESAAASRSSALYDATHITAQQVQADVGLCFWLAYATGDAGPGPISCSELSGWKVLSYSPTRAGCPTGAFAATLDVDDLTKGFACLQSLGPP